MSYLIDSHCHLHDEEWFTPAQAEDLIVSARANHVEKIITIGTDPEDSENARLFAAQHENIYWTYGIHPEFASKITPADLDAAISSLKNSLSSAAEVASRPAEPASAIALKADGHEHEPLSSFEGHKTWASALERPEKDAERFMLNANPAPLAIGEIGLDYHYDDFDRAAEIRLFERLLQLATDLALPVSLHIRGAFDDALPILDNFPHLTGVVHSFTGSKKVLRQVLSRDFYIGVNGLTTYSTLPLPPLEKMLLETDAPFLTPNPFRGTMNKPEYIRLIAEYLSGELGVAEELIAEQTTKNVRELFHL